jgi:hypothetical protein
LGHTITIYVKDAGTDSDLASPVNAIGIAYPGIPRMVNMDYQTVMGMGMSVNNPDNSYNDNDWEGAHITTRIHWDATAGATDITVNITITD